jgi:hypothetical protein
MFLVKEKPRQGTKAPTLAIQAQGGRVTVEIKMRAEQNTAPI